MHVDQTLYDRLQLSYSRAGLVRKHLSKNNL